MERSIELNILTIYINSQLSNTTTKKGGLINAVNKTIKLNNGGWFSKTTKDRLNEYFNDSNLNSFGVFQKKGNWFVLTPNNDHKNALPYENDMILEVA